MHIWIICSLKLWKIDVLHPQILHEVSGAFTFFTFVIVVLTLYINKYINHDKHICITLAIWSKPYRFYWSKNMRKQLQRNSDPQCLIIPQCGGSRGGGGRRAHAIERRRRWRSPACTRGRVVTAVEEADSSGVDDGGGDLQSREHAAGT
jgi:5-methylcytosine-specific restriction endonuclease McrA